MWKRQMTEKSTEQFEASDADITIDNVGDLDPIFEIESVQDRREIPVDYNGVGSAHACCFCSLEYLDSRPQIKLPCCGFLLCVSCFLKKLCSDGGRCWNQKCHNHLGLLRHENGALMKDDLLPRG